MKQRNPVFLSQKAFWSELCSSVLGLSYLRKTWQHIGSFTCILTLGIRHSTYNQLAYVEIVNYEETATSQYPYVLNLKTFILDFSSFMVISFVLIIEIIL